MKDYSEKVSDTHYCMPSLQAKLVREQLNAQPKYSMPKYSMPGKMQGDHSNKQAGP